MKRPNIVAGTGRHVGLLMARMAVRRALRQRPNLLHRSAYILGVELPNDIDTKHYVRALEIELQSLDPEGLDRGTTPEILYFIDDGGKSRNRRKEPLDAYPVLKSVIENQRLVGIGTPKHPMSGNFRNIAEAIVEVGPTRCHLQAAILISRGFNLSDLISDDLIAHNISSLSIAFRGNRPLKEALGFLNAIAEAEASNSAKGSDDEGVLPLEDMSGYGEAKTWGLELVRDLKDFKTGALSWRDVDRGVLLIGKSGTGKTVYARALAKSCGARFVECSLPKAQALGHLGDMLRGIHKAFGEARKNAPTILFFDEFDSIGNRETLSRHAPEYATQVINGLLELMDGSEEREGVVIIAACNRLETIDRAFLRPGRLERIIRINPPARDARQKIFTQHLGTELPDPILLEIGYRTEGWTGADLERLARDTRRKARRSRTATESHQVLELLTGTVRKSSPMDLERYAVHEAGHVIAAYCLLGTLPDTVSIQEFYRTDTGGNFMTGGETILLREERPIHLRCDYLNEISVALAGHAAENLLLGAPSDGAGGAIDSDLAHATFLAARLFASSGVGGSLVFRSEGSRDKLQLALRSDPALTEACDELLKAQMKEVVELLEQNEHLLRKVANLLVERKGLSRADVACLVQGASPAESNMPNSLESRNAS